VAVQPGSGVEGAPRAYDNRETGQPYAVFSGLEHRTGRRKSSRKNGDIFAPEEQYHIQRRLKTIQLPARKMRDYQRKRKGRIIHTGLEVWLFSNGKGCT